MKRPFLTFIITSILTLTACNDATIEEIEEITGFSLSGYTKWGYVKIGNDAFLGDSITIYELQEDFILNPFRDEDSDREQFINGLNKVNSDKINGIVREHLPYFFPDPCPFYYYKSYHNKGVSYHLYVEPQTWGICFVKCYKQ